jgi:hypothetical protein
MVHIDSKSDKTIKVMDVMMVHIDCKGDENVLGVRRHILSLVNLICKGSSC